MEREPARGGEWEARCATRWREERAARLRAHLPAVGGVAATLFLLSAPVDYLFLKDTPYLTAALALRASVILLLLGLPLADRRLHVPARTLDAAATAAFAWAFAVLSFIASRCGVYGQHLDLTFANLLVFLGVIVPWETRKTAVFGAAAWTLYGAVTILAASPAGPAAWTLSASRVLMTGLSLVTAVAAAWIRNGLLRRELAERLRLEDLTYDLSCLAERDELTGLYNYRSFWGALTELTADAERSGKPLSLVLLDLDNFKEYNDTRGHLEGDALLRRLGALLPACLRAGDMAFRQGGDEFAVILPNTDAAAARQVAERLAQHIAAGLEGSGDTPGITASVGVASCREAGYDPLALVEHADADLYRAKRQRGAAERPPDPGPPRAGAG